MTPKDFLQNNLSSTNLSNISIEEENRHLKKEIAKLKQIIKTIIYPSMKHSTNEYSEKCTDECILCKIEKEGI